MTERDPIDDAALEIQEEFNALISEYDSRDVVVRAVTGIPGAEGISRSDDGAEDPGAVGRRSVGFRISGQAARHALEDLRALAWQA